MPRTLPPVAHPDDVEQRFYEALQRGDLAAMMSCWTDEDDAVCVHPGGARLVGLAAVVEMLYHLQLNSALGDTLRFMGMQLNVRSVDSWLGAVLVFATGLGLFELTRREYLRHWGQIQEEIEHEIQRAEGH